LYFLNLLTNLIKKLFFNFKKNPHLEEYAVLKFSATTDNLSNKRSSSTSIIPSVSTVTD